MSRRHIVETVVVAILTAALIAYAKPDSPFAAYSRLSRISDIDKAIWFVGLATITWGLFGGSTMAH